jgi:hypothetical protein
MFLLADISGVFIKKVKEITCIRNVNELEVNDKINLSGVRMGNIFPKYFKVYI